MATGMSKWFEEFFEGGMGSGVMNGVRVDQCLEQADEEHLKADEQVRGILGTKYTVDEMALYFPEEGMLHQFVKHAVQKGWQLFNYAEDNVVTRPIVGSYPVEYWFLRNERRSYRLELLHIPEEGGFSPYHGSLHSVVSKLRVPTMAHASFKVANDLEYGNAMFHLRQAGYEVLQHCESTYGRFSYLRLEDDLPIKPRINTRDAGADSGN